MVRVPTVPFSGQGIRCLETLKGDSHSNALLPCSLFFFPLNFSFLSTSILLICNVFYELEPYSYQEFGLDWITGLLTAIRDISNPHLLYDLSGVFTRLHGGAYQIISVIHSHHELRD